MKLLTSALSFAVLSTGLVLGCASEPTSNDAPDVEESALAPTDEGNEWNGWGISPYGAVSSDGSYGEWNTTFFKSYGNDGTRGGGTCLVFQDTNAVDACSVDTDCASSGAARYGAVGFGYCWYGQCFYRPTVDTCQRSQSNPPGTTTTRTTSSLPQAPNPSDRYWYALGCMTKTAGTGGVNGACGGTNTAAYVRWVNLINAL